MKYTTQFMCLCITSFTDSTPNSVLLLSIVTLLLTRTYVVCVLIIQGPTTKLLVIAANSIYLKATKFSGLGVYSEFGGY